MLNFIINFLKDEDGVTAIEYGLIAALIAVAIESISSAVSGNLGSWAIEADVSPLVAGTGLIFLCASSVDLPFGSNEA